ncbi:MAG: VWA domain-containing protein, partial [Pseudomonadota bacterium]
GAENASRDETNAGDPLSDLMNSQDEAAIQLAIEEAADAAGTADIRFSTQVPFYVQKMLKEMGGEALQERLVDRLQGRAPGDADAAEQLIEIRRDAMRRLKTFVEQQFDTFGAGATQAFMEEALAEKRLDRISRHELERMKALVEKIAKRLAAKLSRRRRQTHRGKLDVRRTLRANAGHGGVPFDLAWKQERKDKPKLVMLCDVSGSVSQYVRFLLMLVFAFRDTIDEVRTFAFSGRLEDVDSVFEAGGFEAGMERIVKTIGMSSTDYGQALSDFRVTHWSEIDRRTTVIILGDGRSNYGDGRLDLFREMAARAKRVVWMSPEHRGLWGTGDSLLLRYKPHCTVLTEVATLKDLERAVDGVLSAYL